MREINLVFFFFFSDQRLRQAYTPTKRGFLGDFEIRTAKSKDAHLDAPR